MRCNFNFMILAILNNLTFSKQFDYTQFNVVRVKLKARGTYEKRGKTQCLTIFRKFERKCKKQNIIKQRKKKSSFNTTNFKVVDCIQLYA